MDFYARRWAFRRVVQATLAAGTSSPPTRFVNALGPLDPIFNQDEVARGFRMCSHSLPSTSGKHTTFGATPSARMFGTRACLTRTGLPLQAPRRGRDPGVAKPMVLASTWVR